MPPRDESGASAEAPTGAKAALVEVVDEFAGADLRDVWVLDQSGQEALYLRDDVALAIEAVDVERYLDNERFGFVTRDTYNELHYSEFAYTVRGFDTWELFRTFLVSDTAKVGVLCSIDRRPGGYDYSWLNDAVHDLLESYDVPLFAPMDE